MRPHFEHHAYSGFEPLQAFDIVYGGHFEHRLLAPGRATLVHQRLILGDLRIESGYYDFPVIAQGAMPEGVICVGLVADGLDATRYNTRPVRGDEIQLYSAGAELLYHATGASRWIIFVVPAERLQALASARGGRPVALPARGIAGLRLSPRQRARLVHRVDDAFALARACAPASLDPALGGAIADALATAYVDALLQSHAGGLDATPSADRHYALVTACERMVLAAGHTDIDLAGLAFRTGYSLRSIERVFRDGVGMPPGRWFRNLRLNGALRDLLAAREEDSVTGVATRWGFRHLSRFSASYRQAFGELPSVTLARARACQG